ncbi:hypothetical protein [Paracoccus ravus]|uniref:hypothetical protein n=1 Tax=Paracoccus ravus TaxID=2447760 RepID=UPI00106DECDA|nr:hypothetical protein [Paracoccus ravus]
MSFYLQFLAEGISAFYLGHSLVSPTLPTMMDDLLNAPVEYQIINGAPLQAQWEHASEAEGKDGLTWLPVNPVDAFILTERVPLAPTIEYHASGDYALRWMRVALEGNPQVQGYLYQTWDEIDGGTSGSTRAWRDRIVADLPLWQGILDSVNDGLPKGAPPMKMIPAGLGMVRLHDAIAAGEVPGATTIHDFFSDGIHPTESGFYYIAMIHFAALTGTSPDGLPRRLQGRWGPYPPVPQDQAKVLQRLAQETVEAYIAD